MYSSCVSKPELLAPAGSRQVLETVVEAGADAVYLSGKRFAMRQHAHWLNFDDEELAAAAKFLHERGRRLYVTVNNLYTDAELELLPDYLGFLVSLKPDALIVTDLGLVRLIREAGYTVPLFASVMMQIHSAEGARQLQALGFSRVIASQSLPLEGVRRIREATGMEVEHFIHGDTCSAVQAMCNHSGIASGELAGRGKCLKPCRWAWDFVSLGPDGQAAGILEENIHALARKDLCLLKQVPKLIQAGITSFKIEGRARKADFLQPIVRAYREAIDAYCADPTGFVYDAGAFRGLQAGRIRDFTTSWTLGNPARAALGLTGEREPRFFSLAIEEKDSALTDERAWNEKAGNGNGHNGNGHTGAAVVARPALTVRCGTLEAARAALEHGADRILIGGEIAVNKARPWRLDQLYEGVALAHAQGAKALLATPRLTAEAQLVEQQWLLKHLEPGAFDAIHVHNLGMLRLAQESTSIPLHADYSFNLFNAAAVAMLATLGARQATLSLEVTLEQALQIRRQTELPLEVLVHGSLPGMLLEQCLIAALTLDLSANAPCPAPCRSGAFALRDRVGQVHPIQADQYCRNHLLMGKELCAIRHLKPFLRAGFASLRLEMPYATERAVGETTRLYRAALDRFAQGRRGELIKEEEVETLKNVSGRPFSLGAYANTGHAIAEADREMPTNVIIRYSSEGQPVADPVKDLA